MTKTFRYGKGWQLKLVFAGLVLWLAQGILTDHGEMTQLASAAGAPPAQGQQDRTSVVIERPPVRFIKDPNPAFSAVAVNSDRDMLVVADENLFQILEYSIQENTPPQARFSEPRRIISGTNTKAEMICGLYIDPVTGDIYALNGDTQNWMPVFSPDDRGNATPSRALHVPGHPFQMAVDEENELIYMSIQSQNTISIYPKYADGGDQPVREIFGSNTQLEDPHGLALDLTNRLIFVSNFGNALVGATAETGRYGKFEEPAITVYSMDASGNAAPLRVIEGPATMMNWPAHLAFHEERQELFVANDADNSILVFSATAEGNAAPIRVIKGPNTGIQHPPGIALDSKLDELYVASMGTPSVTVFPVTANGDVSPLRTIRGAPEGTQSLMIGNPGAVGYDSLRGEILVPN